MGFVTLECKKCGATITLDDSREVGFCQYCGTQIMQDRIIVEHKGSVSIDKTKEIDNLLARARSFYDRGQFDEAEIYYNRILDIEPNNVDANAEILKIYQIVKEPNLTLRVTTGKFYSKSVQVKVVIDGEKQGVITPTLPGIYKLSPGDHIIKVKIIPLGSKTSTNVIVYDRFTKLDYTVKCTLGNNIAIYNNDMNKQ